MNALEIVKKAVLGHLSEGDFAIDATAGRGYDTAFLARTVGRTGRVLAFDIQKDAVESTRALLASEGLDAEVLLASHADMALYAAPETASCILFNLGIMCVTIYSGGANGYAERDALLPFLATLDDKRFQVLALSFHNWKKDPPMPFFITKL